MKNSITLYESTCVSKYYMNYMGILWNSFLLNFFLMQVVLCEEAKCQTFWEITKNVILYNKFSNDGLILKTSQMSQRKKDDICRNLGFELDNNHETRHCWLCKGFENFEPDKKYFLYRAVTLQHRPKQALEWNSTLYGLTQWVENVGMSDSHTVPQEQNQPLIICCQNFFVGMILYQP